jgi:hypothetical protein
MSVAKEALDRVIRARMNGFKKSTAGQRRRRISLG